MRFRFIDAERAGLAMPIFRLCRLLQVSVSGFYAWRNRGPSQRQLDDMVLLAHVRAAFRRSRESYGAERVHHELAENGIEVGRHRVARLMRGNGMSPKRQQKFKKTTDSQHNKAVASNLLDQTFSAEAPNEKWAADISYIWTAQGWLYLAVMLDLYSRRVIGWAVGARLTSDLPLRALNPDFSPKNSVESDYLLQTNSYKIFGKRQKYRVFFRSGPFFVRRREGLHGFGKPLQGAPRRRPVFPVLQHIEDRLVG